MISMGGTFLRLVDQGHEVHVAYQTSGNIAVFDDDVIRFTDYFRDLNKDFEISNRSGDELYAKVVSCNREQKNQVMRTQRKWLKSKE